MKFKIEFEIEINPEEYADLIVEQYILNPTNPWWDDNRYGLHKDRENTFNLDLHWNTRPGIHNKIREFWKEWIEGNYHIPRDTECPDNILDIFENWTFSNVEKLNKRALELREYGIKHHQKIIEEHNKSKEDILEFYSDPNYNPPKNSKSCIYKGKEYKSKKQCCILENISLNTLNKYLYDETRIN